jgi:hypothetical protein
MKGRGGYTVLVLLTCIDILENFWDDILIKTIKCCTVLLRMLLVLSGIVNPPLKNCLQV